MFSSTEDKPSSDELSKLKVQARIELDKLEAQSTAKEVAGKSIGMRVPRSFVVPLMIGVVALVALLATHTFEMLALLTIAYIAAVPLMVRRYRSLERSHAAESAAKSDP